MAAEPKDTPRADPLPQRSCGQMQLCVLRMRNQLRHAIDPVEAGTQRISGGAHHHVRSDEANGMQRRDHLGRAREPSGVPANE
jgi:hypothetical protein